MIKAHHVLYVNARKSVFTHPAIDDTAFITVHFFTLVVSFFAGAKITLERALKNN